MELYLFFIAITMVAAQGEVPQQPPQGMPVQQNQETQQVTVGQGQPNIHIQQQQEQILQQQQQILQQQQQQAVNMQQGNQAVHHAAGEGRNLIRDKNHIQDREHIKLHLNGVIEDDTAQDMSDRDLQLHYFKAHDYDNNMKLDGLEILKAVSHFHSEGGEDHNPPPLDDEQLIQLVDPILAEDDKNRDGYIDYPEFASNQS